MKEAIQSIIPITPSTNMASCLSKIITWNISFCRKNNKTVKAVVALRAGKVVTQHCTGRSSVIRMRQLPKVRLLALYAHRQHEWEPQKGLATYNKGRRLFWSWECSAKFAHS